jgi:hypothetical protein
MTNQQRSHMTHNGQPWASNIGEVGSGFLYGWAAQRGVEAAMRQHQRMTPQAAATAGTVGGLWIVVIAMRIIQWFFIVNSLWLVGIGFYHGLRTGLVCAALGAFGIGSSLLSLSVAKHLLRRAERLPSRRSYKSRSSFLVWMLLFWGPSFAYLPFYTQVPH